MGWERRGHRLSVHVNDGVGSIYTHGSLGNDTRKEWETKEISSLSSYCYLVLPFSFLFIHSLHICQQFGLRMKWYLSTHLS